MAICWECLEIYYKRLNDRKSLDVNPKHEYKKDNLSYLEQLLEERERAEANKKTI
jgi:hypothetical protein